MSTDTTARTKPDGSLMHQLAMPDEQMRYLPEEIRGALASMEADYIEAQTREVPGLIQGDGNTPQRGASISHSAG